MNKSDIKLLLDAGQTAEEISELFGVTLDEVNRIANAEGFEIVSGTAVTKNKSIIKKASEEVKDVNQEDFTAYREAIGKSWNIGLTGIINSALEKIGKLAEKDPDYLVRNAGRIERLDAIMQRNSNLAKNDAKENAVTNSFIGIAELYAKRRIERAEKLKQGIDVDSGILEAEVTVLAEEK